MPACLVGDAVVCRLMTITTEVMTLAKMATMRAMMPMGLGTLLALGTVAPTRLGRVRASSWRPGWP